MKEFVPVLRFSEFEEEWKEKKLGEVGETVGGLTYSPDDVSEDGVLVLRSSNVQNGNLCFKDKVCVKVDKFNSVRLHDILICVRNGSRNLIGKNALITKEAEGSAFGAFMTIYRSDFNLFLYQWMQGDDFKRYVGKNLGATINSINGSDLKSFTLNIPSLQEQTKIADFLSAVDEQISLLTEKQEKLQTYKRGVMQQLFSQELRFKDEHGVDYPEWEEKKLGEIANFFSGGTPKSSDKNFYNGNIPFIKSGEIGSAYTEQYLSEIGLSSSSAKMVEKGDVLYALYGATSGQVALSLIDGAINQAVLCIKPFDINSRFLVEVLKYNKESIVGKYIQGGQGNLSGTIVKGLEFYLPSLSEQAKIADFLTAIDSQLEEVEGQIAQTKLFKQGLLQKMFV